MSSSDSESNGDAPGRREVAHRLFAAEFEDADFSYSESDEERAPNYVVTPTGARVNRLFAVGVLTEVEPVSDEVLRGRIVDPTGAFVTYAGQYQPDAMAYLDRTTPPAFVALSGKARTFQPEDSDVVYTSVRPESVNSVDADTRDRWTVAAAEATLERVGVMAAALDADLRGDALADALAEAGVRESLAAGVPLALDHYGTTRGYLDAARRLAVDALEVVAGEREEVRGFDATPDQRGEGLGSLPERFRVELDAAAVTAGERADAETQSDGTPADATDAADSGTGTAASASETGSPSDAAGSEAAEADATGGASTAEQATATDAEVEAAPAATSDADTDTDASEAAQSTPSGTLGDFDAGDDASSDLGDFDSDATGAADEDATDDDGLFELDDEERREVQEQYGTEFESGSEVDAPGEAGIDVPDADDLDAALREADEAAATAGDDTAADGTETSADGPSDATTGESDDAATEGSDAAATGESDGDVNVDVESAAVDAMADLDDGDGAEREAVVAAVVDEHGVAAEDVEDAIESALMGGRCYEPTEDRLKAI